jgi:hypothetical protein
MRLAEGRRELATAPSSESKPGANNMRVQVSEELASFLLLGDFPTNKLLEGLPDRDRLSSGLSGGLRTFDGQALRGDLLMTKTSGPGKRTPILKFVVDSEAWVYNRECAVLDDNNWLAIGWQLYDEVRDDWDCLLPLPTQSEDALSEFTPSYVQSCVASRKLMADMVYPQHLLGHLGVYFFLACKPTVANTPIVLPWPRLLRCSEFPRSIATCSEDGCLVKREARTSTLEARRRLSAASSDGWRGRFDRNPRRSWTKKVSLPILELGCWRVTRWRKLSDRQIR